MYLHQKCLSYSHNTNTNVALKKYLLAANSSQKNVFHRLSGFPSPPHLQASEKGNLSTPAPAPTQAAADPAPAPAPVAKAVPIPALASAAQPAEAAAVAAAAAPSPPPPAVAPPPPAALKNNTTSI